MFGFYRAVCADYIIMVLIMWSMIIIYILLHMLAEKSNGWSTFHLANRNISLTFRFITNIIRASLRKKRYMTWLRELERQPDLTFNTRHMTIFFFTCNISWLKWSTIVTSQWHSDCRLTVLNFFFRFLIGSLKEIKNKKIITK